MQQYGLLCEERWKISLIGATYYIGAVLTLILTSWLADTYGRRWVTVTALFILVAASLVILPTDNLTVLYVCSFFLGTTQGGRFVAVTFLMEYIPNRARYNVTLVKNVAVAIQVILITLFFQFGTRHY